MSFVPARCPNCLRTIQVSTESNNSKCIYCGGEIISPLLNVMASTANIPKLLAMGRSTLSDGNYFEAESHFNKVLELDPRNVEAWIGKGKSAALQCSLIYDRLQVIVVAFNHAISNCKGGDDQQVVETCIEELNNVVTTLYSIARSHMLEYVTLQSTWEKYTDQVRQLLEILEVALVWNESHSLTLKNIIQLSKETIEGVIYRDPYAHNALKGWTLTNAQAVNFIKKFDSAEVKLRAMDPGYVAPVIEVKKLESCFVVSATFGDEKHPTVTLLRQFRKEVLSGSPYGRQFIYWYSKNGPKFAGAIAESKWRRLAAFLILVLPASFLAKLVLCHRRKHNIS